MSDEQYQLIISFPDQSPNFVHGFEAGGIWERMKDGKPISDYVHQENVELLSAMATRQRYKATFFDPTSDKDEWAVMRAEKEDDKHEIG